MLRAAMDSPGAIPRGVTTTTVGLRTGTAVGVVVGVVEVRGGATFSVETFSLGSSRFSGCDGVDSCESVYRSATVIKSTSMVFNPPELRAYRSAGLSQRRVILCRHSLGSHH